MDLCQVFTFSFKSKHVPFCCTEHADEVLNVNLDLVAMAAALEVEDPSEQVVLQSQSMAICAATGGILTLSNAAFFDELSRPSNFGILDEAATTDNDNVAMRVDDIPPSTPAQLQPSQDAPP